MGMNPVERAAGHFRDPFGQIARGQPSFAIGTIGFKPAPEVASVLCTECDFGHVEWHDADLGSVALGYKAAGDG